MLVNKCHLSLKSNKIILLACLDYKATVTFNSVGKKNTNILRLLSY